MKRFLLVFILSICMLPSFGQKWWKEIKENSIPENLYADTLFVMKYKVGNVFKSENKVNRANKKLNRVFKRYYPYPFKVINKNELQPGDTNYVFSWREFNRTYEHEVRDYNHATKQTRYRSETSNYYTNKYHFLRADYNEIYPEIGIYSSFKFKTIKMLLRGIRTDIAGITESNIIKLEILGDPFQNTRHFNIAYERAINRTFSFDINWLSGNKTESGKSLKYRLIEPGIRLYLSYGVNYAKGFYLCFAPTYYKTGIKLNDGSFKWHNLYGLTPSFGFQFNIFRRFVLSYNFKAAYQISNWNTKTDSDIMPYDLNPLSNIQIGYRF